MGLWSSPPLRVRGGRGELDSVKPFSKKILSLSIAIAVHILFFAGLIFWSSGPIHHNLWSGGRGSGGEHVAYVDLGTLPISGKSDASQTVSDMQQDDVSTDAQKKIPVKNLPQTQKKNPKKSPLQNNQNQNKTQQQDFGKGNSDTPSGGTGNGLDKNGVNSASAPSVLAQIRKRIMQKKNYPIVAKENGWIGSVKLSFKINASGGLEFVKLLQSSGHEILDQSALETIRKAAPLPYYPDVIALSLEYNLVTGD